MWIQSSKKNWESGGLTSGDPITITCNPMHDMHQLEFYAVDGTGKTLTGGTVKFETRDHPDAELEPLQKDDADYTLTFAANGVRKVTIPMGSFNTLVITPTVTITGGAGITKYGVRYTGGRRG